MESEISFLVTYRCSRCRTLLSAEAGQSSSWLRCPQCGRAGLPPNHAATPPSSLDAQKSMQWSSPNDATEDILVITDDGSSTVMPGVPFSVGRESPRKGSGRRLVLVTGLFLSMLVLLFSALDQNGVSAAASGFVALACIGFLMIPTRR